MVLTIAKSGLFNLPNFTPLRSAELANLHEAYQFITYEYEAAAAKVEK
jgi:hypothetical protein